MMSQITPLATFATSHETAISWINQQLITFGLVVRPSFDLQVAKSTHIGCTCPHHGTANCDCQIVVLLVYGEQDEPISLVVHSQDGNTHLSMTGALNSGGKNTLPSKIVHALGYQNINI
ncbi:hypothetical protein KA005_37155 [bacterium]|nr:hypothetical protein [bacterium]